VRTTVLETLTRCVDAAEEVALAALAAAAPAQDDDYS
jgi:hypothetical protein